MGERLSQAFKVDAYKPALIAIRVEAAGVAVAKFAEFSEAGCFHDR
jgi:hypothetical protein